MTSHVNSPHKCFIKKIADVFAFKVSKKGTDFSEMMPAQACIFIRIFVPPEILSVEQLTVPEIIVITSVYLPPSM